MLKPEIRWLWRLIVSAMFLEAVLLTDQIHSLKCWLPQATIMQFGLVLVCLCLLVIVIYHVPPSYVLLLIVAFIPFDFSVTLPYLTALSTIDYFCAAGLA